MKTIATEIFVMPLWRGQGLEIRSMNQVIPLELVLTKNIEMWLFH